MLSANEHGLEPTATPTLGGVRTPIFDSDPSGGREAMVFVHGNPGPMADWSELCPRAAGFGRVIAMDLPAFGDAGRPRRFDFSPRGYARHLGQVIEWAGIDHAHLVLHDFGGSWGLHWACSHPGAVRSVSLINTGVLRNYEWHGFAKLWQTPLIGEVFQALVTRRAIRFAMRRSNPTPLPPWFTARVAAHADLRQKLAVLALYRAAREVESAFPDPQLDVPACVIWGAADRYVDVSHAEAQKAFFPEAEVHILEGLGHWPFIDDPRAVGRCLIPFLRRQFMAGRHGVGAGY